MLERMKINCAFTELVELHKIQPNPRNPNKHGDKQVDMLAKIIDYQGQRLPLIISKRSGFLVSGHGRLQALQKLGWEKAAVDFQDFESEAQEFAHLIADNKIAELADHDDNFMIEGIKELELEGMDFELLGMPDFELPLEVDPVKEEIEDEVPENVETRVKPGDLWKLGEHRLLCGDATNIQHVERLMNGERADMVFTDPPYGMNLETDYSFAKNTYGNVKSKGGNKYEKVKGDNEDFEPELINTIFASFGYVLEIFVWGADYFAEHIPERNEGSWVVWDKRQNDSEDDERAKSADKAFGSAFELCWSKAKHKRLFARIRSGIFGVNNEQGNSKRVHPTEKPVQLAQWFLEKWGKPQDKVVDLFGGSGSTLIACEKTKRKCFMMEIDPHYCSVILARWEKYSGKTAELIESDGALDQSPEAAHV